MKNSDMLKGNPTCFRCHRVNDGYTSTSDDRPPKTGDICVCLYCSAVMQFNISEDGTVTFTEAPAEIIAEVMLELSQIQSIVTKLRKWKDI